MIQRLLAIALVVLACARSARAHPLDVGYLRIETRGAEVSFVLELAVDAAGALLGVEATQLDATVVGARAPALAAATYMLAPITTPAGPCTWTAPSATINGRSVRIVGGATCPGAGGPRTWMFPLVRGNKLSSTFELLVKETIAGAERLTVVDRYDATIELSAAVGELGFWDVVWSGVVHIGVAPSEWHDAGAPALPDGIDHLLFLVGLMLGGGTLLTLIGIASGFTLGHSISLALAALNIVRPPAWFIEPAIALTIALVAVEAYTGWFKRRRFMIAAGFGLIHGFGFANALVELELSTRGMVTALFGYNLGVELGQLAFVLVLAPLVLLAHRHERVRPVVVQGGAAMIFLAGMSWFVERIAANLTG